MRAAALLAVAGVIVGSLALGVGPASAAPSTTPVPIGPAELGSRLAEFDLPGTVPNDIVAGAEGSVWISFFPERMVAQLDRAGAVMRTVTLTAGPSSLATDGEGGVWATEYTGNAIAHVTAAGAVTEVPLPTADSMPAGVYDSGAYVFFTESNTGKVGRYEKATGAFISKETYLDTPFFITGKDGRILATSSRGGVFASDLDFENWDLFGWSNERVRMQAVVTKVYPRAEDRGYVISENTVDSFGYDHTGGRSEGIRIDKRVRLTDIAADGDDVWFLDAGTNSIGWMRQDQLDAEYVVGDHDLDLAALTSTENGRYVWAVGKKSGTVVRLDLLEVSRLAGADRFETAAVASARTHPGTADLVFVVSGEKFADALSAGPVAAFQKAPMLLTSGATLPDEVSARLAGLAPKRVVVVGGPASVSEEVLAEIRAGTKATVERIGGADRYAVSRALVDSDLAPNGPILYLANGADYPDALSSTAAAAHSGSPVLLVNGTADTLAAADLAIVDDFSEVGTTVTLVGGPRSLSPGIEAQVKSVVPIATRVGGADRYAVSLELNTRVFGPVDSFYLASGATFPDALAGGVVAAAADRPLFLSRPDCVPAALTARLTPDRVRSVTLLGGENTLARSVAALTSCG